MNKYIEVAAMELDNPSLELTKQYLAVHGIEKLNNDYIFDRIDNTEESVIIYFKIIDERFFLALRIDIASDKVVWVYPENGNDCYLTATSEFLSLLELQNFTSIKSTDGHSKGDVRKLGGRKYQVSRINFRYSVNESYDTESAIKNLLDYLDQDKNGIKKLIEHSEAYISINKHQYVSANAGLHIDKVILERLFEYSLELDIDTYIVGKPLKG